ncbi:EscT/YscT/HrcT family type III secretion system export apparatus protein [Hahella sp. KA22]|uniref:type III secretion system export apparatus subunit SctT n=1 Tax=Hahella sp. KA22 TaxID=1628392 RepID=UPI000FDDE1C4|nr:type III secretion system export apparatus subunit SctT [Hahella sp. KA22]AZZ91034.1 EscT/YscT/HrcT family type III secretion system export apparatus protein [Hahella sp. KA22]QAY54404.1 EscT/YscT/HrcT family type III secretion system export apparatus protein [Hahella sp. KA22]
MMTHLMSDTLTLFMFTVPRLLAAMSVMPFLSKSFFGGTLIRNGVVLSLSLFLFPIVDEGYKPETMEPFMYALIIFKEVIIGFCLGWLAALPFWALEAVGFFIDNQRGSTMASAMNPLTGSQASPVGILFVQTFTTLFFLGGNFLTLMGAIYASYHAWPIFSFFPRIELSAAGFFFAQLDYFMSIVVLFAAPLIACMFLAEFGLGLVSRFAPQLNVFFLSMPVKSLVCMVMLTFYVGVLMRIFDERYLRTFDLFKQLNVLWGS